MSLPACLAGGCLITAFVFIVVDAHAERSRRRARPAALSAPVRIQAVPAGSDGYPPPLSEAAAIVRRCIEDHPDLLAFANSLVLDFGCARCGGPLAAGRCPRCQQVRTPPRVGR